MIYGGVNYIAPRNTVLRSTLKTEYRSTAGDTATNRAEMQGHGQSPLRQRGAEQHRNNGGHENGCKEIGIATTEENDGKKIYFSTVRFLDKNSAIQ